MHARLDVVFRHGRPEDCKTSIPGSNPDGASKSRKYRSTTWLARDVAGFTASTDAAQWLTENAPRPEDKLLGGALRDHGVIADTGFRNGEIMQVFRGRNASMSDFAVLLGPPMGRSVIDRTGLTGPFNFDFWVAPLEYGLLSMFGSAPRATSPTIFAALEAAGLELQPTKAVLETVVVDDV